MRKSAILEAHIHDEPESSYRIPKAVLPKLSYTQALQSYFIAAGAIHQVGNCPTRFIEEFINGCVATAKNPKSCAEALEGLDYRESVSRFYALNELLRLCATVPLFKSRQEVEKALIAHNMGIQRQSIAV